MRALNPFLTTEEAEHVLDSAASCALHSSRVGQASRAVVEAKALLKLLRPRSGDFGATDEARHEAAAAIGLKARTLAETLAATRNYVTETEGATTEGTRDLGFTYDPRFLLFEFTFNILLREAQVALVREFVSSLRSGQPLVKQMLMGGGKTTVVGPLLTLLLADTDTLVVQTMPPSLLEQSRETLRATFSSIVKKRIYTLNYDRSSDMTWATVQKLRAARRHCGVLLCSASTIKSVELKLLEALDTLADPRRVQSLSSERQVKTIKGALDIFATGVLVMDEVVCEV